MFIQIREKYAVHEFPTQLYTSNLIVIKYYAFEILRYNQSFSFPFFMKMLDVDKVFETKGIKSMHY